MKLMTRILTILLMATVVVSCSDDDDNGPAPSGPSVTAASSSSVTTGQSVDLTFSVQTPAGYGSSSVTAEGGSASISAEPESGSNGGDVVVTFTANASGAGSVVLSVTDSDGLTDDATAVVTVSDQETDFVVTDNITEDTTWEDGNTYELAGRIAVEAGATLTIEPGVVIKGQEGQGANATALVVARDAEIQANGTADQPIIFTSVGDEITPADIDAGNFASPNLANDVNGRWGGVIILGNAPVSVSSGSETNIEGIPPSDPNGLYGGDDPTDSSGSFTYVSIRHGGTDIGAGNEINGLSLGGVGNGTTIDNIEIVANRDDGVEFFGGTVNATNVLVWNNGDDAIDTDQAWSGTIDNMVLISPGGSVFELDGPEGSFTSTGHTITNATAYAMGNGNELLIDVDANTDVNINNILFIGLTDGTRMDTNYSEFASNTNGYAIESLEAVLPMGTSLSTIFPQPLIDAGEVNAVASVSAATVGATDIGTFSFTWASTSGALAELGIQ